MSKTTQSIDLRTAARALLASDEPLALSPSSLAKVRAIARADSPVTIAAELPVGADGEAVAWGGRSSTGKVAGVAVIALQGIITPRGSWLSMLFGGGPGGLQGFRRDLNEALNDDDVTAIVLDIHSPGGLIGLVPETAAELRGHRGEKPIVAVCNTMAASAAYWIAAQADEVVATPSGFAGSIGVYLVHEDWSGFNEELGIVPEYIAAGRYKVEANPDHPLEDEARAALQAEVDDLYGLFVSDVAKGRGATPKAVRDGYGQGRVLPAGRAVGEKLIDRVATIEDVVRGLAKGRSGGGRSRRASDPSPTIRESDTPAPNGADETPEEVRARIAELAGTAPRHL